MRRLICLRWSHKSYCRYCRVLVHLFVYVLGNHQLHLITSQSHYELWIDMEDWNGNITYAKYKIFRITDSTQNYALIIEGYEGNAGRLTSKFQSGFRTERSPNDNLNRLETFIHDAFIKREHVVAVIFDFKMPMILPCDMEFLKTYTILVWKEDYVTLLKVFFFEARTIQVRVGTTLSDLYDQEQGVPQGALLSTILFKVKLNNIINCRDYKTDSSLYVDDFCTCFRSKNMRTIERHL